MARQVLIFIAIGAVLATACAPQQAGPAGSAAPSAAASEQPVKGGTAIVAIWQEPTTLNPLYQNQTVVGVVISDLVSEGLAHTAASGDYEPLLAKSVPTVNNGGVKLSSDGKTMDVTWELKPGLKWSDGEPITSADVKFTWERWMKDEKVVNRAGFDQISSIDAPNDLTAVVHYKSVYSPYPLNFADLLPKHAYEKVAELSTSEFNRKPLTSGPFKVTDFKVGESITLERNTNWREQGKPYLDKIIFKSVPSSQVAIAQLKAGEVHAMWNLLESEAADLEKDPGVKVQFDPGPSVERIELNTAENRDMTDPNSKHPVLSDIEMRKALLYATPKQQIIDKLLAGKTRVANSPVTQGWAAYKEPQEGYDPKKANDTLDKAGWTRGPDGIRTKSGARASLSITSTTGNATREKVEQVLIDEYKAIGVELKIANQPSSVFLSGSWTQGDPRKRGSFDLAMYGSSPGIDPHTTVSQRYTSKNIPSAANKGVGQNYTRVKNTEIDKAVDEAGATLDQEKRKAAYAKALRLLNQEYVIIWLYDRADIDGYRPELHGIEQNAWQQFTANAKEWWLKK